MKSQMMCININCSVVLVGQDPLVAEWYILAVLSTAVGTESWLDLSLLDLICRNG